MSSPKTPSKSLFSSYVEQHKETLGDRRCTTCKYLLPSTWKSCYLCGFLYLFERVLSTVASVGETKSSTFEGVCDEICAEGTSAWQSWKQLRGHGSKTKDLHARASVLDDKECVDYMNRFVRRHCSKYGRTFDRAVAMLNSFLQSKDLPAVFSLAGGELTGSPRVATPTMNAARPPVAPKQSKPAIRRPRATAGAGKRTPPVAKLSAKRLADVGLENVASADAHASLLLLAIKVDVFSASEPPAVETPVAQRSSADSLPPAHGPMGGKAARVATLGLRSPLRKLMLEQVVLV